MMCVVAATMPMMLAIQRVRGANSESMDSREFALHYKYYNNAICEFPETVIPERAQVIAANMFS